MSIDDYLATHGMTAAQLAKKLRCSKAAISHWRCGRFQPGPRLRRALRRVTKGEGDVADFPRTRRVRVKNFDLPPASKNRTPPGSGTPRDIGQHQGTKRR
jgi:transcriptional regulator with XRE-family HTH domain